MQLNFYKLNIFIFGKAASISPVSSDCSVRFLLAVNIQLNRCSESWRRDRFGKHPNSTGCNYVDSTALFINHLTLRVNSLPVRSNCHAVRIFFRFHNLNKFMTVNRLRCDNLHGSSNQNITPYTNDASAVNVVFRGIRNHAREGDRHVALIRCVNLCHDISPYITLLKREFGVTGAASFFSSGLPPSIESPFTALR
ncbi:hypothetical protein BPP3_55 [Escherichia phage CLB_P3]|nr:hypothetical protein BPP3_55 [Escherichia phage CLB_P3]